MEIEYKYLSEKRIYVNMLISYSKNIYMTAQLGRSNLPFLLYPNSIAVTGVTQNPEDLGSYILRNIIFSNYKGKVYPVSSSINQFYDFPSYSDIRSIPGDIDLAILTTTSDRVIDDVYACSKSKVRNICIASSGFSESGHRGLVLQKKIVKLARESGINIIGPNSLGIISTSKNLNATFAPSMPPKGKVVFLSQSGALINALVEYSSYYGLGISEIIGLGNKADVHEIDFIEYYASLRQDGQPTVIGSYLENVADGQIFIDECQHLTSRVPFVCLIPSSSETRDYIYDHSGSILQRNEVIDLALRQAGALRVHTQQQLFDSLLAFSWQIKPTGNKIAIISNAGGGAILAIEDLLRSGLTLVKLSQEVRKNLSNNLDWKGRNMGVIDLGGQAASLKYLKALDIVLGDSDVDAVLVILSPQIMTEIEESAEVIGRLSRQHGKTIIAAFMGYEEVEKGIKALSRYFIPAFNSVDRAVYALSKMCEYTFIKKSERTIKTKSVFPIPFEKKRPMKVIEIIERARIEKRFELRLDENLELLKQFGIKTSSFIPVHTLKELQEEGEKIGYPFIFHCFAGNNEHHIKSFSEARRVYEDHINKNPLGRSHTLSDHAISREKIQKELHVSIQKDTYYDSIDKGFSINDLKKLSFGYIISIKVEGGKQSSSISALLPITKVHIEELLQVSNILKEFGSVSGERFDKLRKNFTQGIEKICHIPLEFPQFLSLDVFCAPDNDMFIATKMKAQVDFAE
jgi:acyl-CoA synthetase (NDP forming)